MCVATPLRVETVEGLRAQCIDRYGERHGVDLSLVGPVAPGDWLLAFLGAAREIIDEARARQIDRALRALDAVLAGDASSIDDAFPDLVGREPQLPDFLR